jgi:heat-inducible transcriptional repressor
MAEHRVSARKEAILRALVEEYVSTGEPVSSKILADQLSIIHGGGYGAATIRHELASLEDDGLILQPHVSAGRVPTDLGYRYFVGHLMGESRLALEEQRLIRHQFYQVQHQLDEWVRLTASILAQALHSAAVVTPPRALEARLKHFEVLALYESVVLLVVVLDDGAVRQERLVLDLPIAQDDLSRMARRLNERFQGATADEVAERIQRAATTFEPVEHAVVMALARILAQVDPLVPDYFYSEGIAQLLSHEEFAHGDPERMRRVVEVLRQNSFLPALAPHLRDSEGVQVIIGGENESEALHDMSLIVARYGVKGEIGGLVGILAPTRMHYSRAIAVVRYLTQMLSDLLAETYRPGRPVEENVDE